MVKSNKRKRKVRKLTHWRKTSKDGNFKCRKCHKDLRSTVHHFLCNACWKKEKAIKNRKMRDKNV